LRFGNWKFIKYMVVEPLKSTQQQADMDKIAKILKTNREYLQAIYASCERSRKYILWGRIMSLVYILIILAPILFAIFYLPPMLKTIIKPYQQLFSTQESADDTQDTQDYIKVIKELGL